jgi:hypothetical protein
MYAQHLYRQNYFPTNTVAAVLFWSEPSAHPVCQPKTQCVQHRLNFQLLLITNCSSWRKRHHESMHRLNCRAPIAALNRQDPCCGKPGRNAPYAFKSTQASTEPVPALLHSMLSAQHNQCWNSAQPRSESRADRWRLAGINRTTIKASCWLSKGRQLQQLNHNRCAGHRSQPAFNVLCHSQAFHQVLPATVEVTVLLGPEACCYAESLCRQTLLPMCCSKTVQPPIRYRTITEWSNPCTGCMP